MGSLAAERASLQLLLYTRTGPDSRERAGSGHGGRGSHAHARTSSCSTKVRRWDNMCFASTILHLLFNQQNLRNFIDCACSTIHLNAKFASKVSDRCFCCFVYVNTEQQGSCIVSAISSLRGRSIDMSSHLNHYQLKIFCNLKAVRDWSIIVTCTISYTQFCNTFQTSVDFCHLENNTIPMSSWFLV